MDSPIITLTTDWSTADFYVGRVKGRLFSLVPGARVVDISHSIPVADRIAASIVVANACREFPEGTIHIVDVSGLRVDEPIIVVEAYKQYYIMLDNGLPSLIFGNDYNRAIAIDQQHIPARLSFAAYDLYCYLAAQIAVGTDIATFGSPLDKLQQALPFSYTDDDNRLALYINYIDTYGNAYLGISYSDFERLRSGRQFTMNVRKNEIKTITPNAAYCTAPGNIELRLTIATTGALMLTLNQSTENTSRLFGLRINDLVSVVFS